MGAASSVINWGLFPVEYTLDFVQSITMGKSSNSPFLHGNFGPVSEEVFFSDLEVIGEIPVELSGEFVRNGPNPKYVPKGGYHWFDGDGMLHGVRIKDQKITYLNRYVRTKRLQDEEKADRVIYPRIGEWRGVIGLFKILLLNLKTKVGAVNADTVKGEGTANTALTFHHGKLMALVEADQPYALNILNDGKFELLGKLSYDGKLKHAMTAHPKIDPITNELIFFGYELMKKPYCTYSVVSADGKLLHSTAIDIPHPVMMHDFAITENYSIFMDFPLEFHPKEIVKGDVFIFNKNRPARIGIIPRHPSSKDDIKWYEFETGFIFHTVNAWEDGDEIVMIGCRSKVVNLTNLGELKDECVPYPYCYRINRITGEKSERKLFDVGCEFPTIHPALMGRKNRYTYSATFARVDHRPLFNGVVKLDLVNEEVVGKIIYGEGKYAGECVFVPRHSNDQQGVIGDEDDGFLLTFLFDENTNSSQFIIMDAKTMSDTPIAVVNLPQRVPYGFHGIYVSEDQMQHQNNIIL